MTRRSPAPPAGLARATVSEHDGVRYLHLDSIWVQGAMRLRRPSAIELEYVQRMMAWLLLFEPAGLSARHAVQLGLGAGAITRFCHGPLRMRTTAVEINPEVVAANRAFFRLPADGPRLSVVLADAADWVADARHAGTADALCIDLYDHEAAGPVHDAEAFYRDCRRVLVDGGVLSVNLFGRDASFERSATRLARVFGADRVRSLQPTREGNTVLLALRDADWPARSVLAERAAAHEARCGLPCRKWVRMLRTLPASVVAAASGGGD
jgi:spermidine synthase